MIEATFDMKNNHYSLNITGSPDFALYEIAFLVVATYQHLERTNRTFALGCKILFNEHFSKLNSPLWDVKIDTEGAELS